MALIAIGSGYLFLEFLDNRCYWLQVLVILLLFSGIFIGWIAKQIIRHESKEFFRTIITSRKIERLLGLHESINKDQYSSLNKKGLSNYIFREEHIYNLEDIEKMSTDKENYEIQEEKWVEKRVGEYPVPKYFSRIFLIYICLSSVFILYSIISFIYCFIESEKGQKLTAFFVLFC